MCSKIVASLRNVTLEAHVVLNKRSRKWEVVLLAEDASKPDLTRQMEFLEQECSKVRLERLLLTDAAVARKEPRRVPLHAEVEIMRKR